MNKSDIELIVQIAKDVEMQGGRMYYCGGFVRDKILGRNSSDIDIKLCGIAKSRFNEILSKYGSTIWVGQSSEIAKLKRFPEIDFASPVNKDGTVYTLDEVVKNCDFTMNSMLEDVLTGEVIDVYSGIQDIEDRKIRLASINDPDPMVSLRACRFASKYGFEIDEKTNQKFISNRYENLNPLRVWQEMRKVINSSCKPSVFLQKALETRTLARTLYPLQKLVEKTVSVDGKDINAFEHTKRMLDVFYGKKGQVSNYMEYYMAIMCLHLEDKKDFFSTDLREFFASIANNKGVRRKSEVLAYYGDKFKDAFKNIEQIPDEKFKGLCNAHRLDISDMGYVMYSYFLAGTDMTKEDIDLYEGKLKLWQHKVKAVSERKDVNKVTTGNFGKAKDKATNANNGRTTNSSKISRTELEKTVEDIMPNDVLEYFSRSTRKVKSSRKMARTKNSKRRNYDTRYY